VYCFLTHSFLCVDGFLLHVTYGKAIVASKVIHFSDNSIEPLSWAEALSLATLGGSQALGIDDKVGSLEPGKAFDAVIVDPCVPGSPIDALPTDSTEDVISKFVYLGDDRNFVSVFVNGVDRLPSL
jgi:guanine deaminase